MNRKLCLLIVILSGLSISALITKNGDLLLLGLPFLVWLIFGVAQAPTEISFQAVRHIDKPSVIAGEPVELRISLTNLGNGVKNLYLDEPIFPGMTIVEGQPIQRRALSPGETTELRYMVDANRGIYTWQTIRVVASDPLGLFEFEQDVPAPGQIMVRPASMQVRPFQLPPRSTLPIAGPISAHKAGLGTDFWSIREYRAGDSLRRINWHWMARHPQKLFTNEFEREEIADYGLILDARRLTRNIEVETAIFERSVSAMAALGRNFLRYGNRVSLMIFGKHFRTAFPGYGKQQRDILVRNLAGAKLGGDLPLTSINHFPIQLFPTRSLLVVISTYSDRDREAYARLRSHGYEIILISPDPIDFAARMYPNNETNALAVRAARVERVLMLNRLVKLGIKVIVWQVDQPLEPLIREAARKMSRNRSML